MFFMLNALHIAKLKKRGMALNLAFKINFTYGNMRSGLSICLVLLCHCSISKNDLCLISLQFNKITLGSKGPSPIKPLDSVQYVTNVVV